MSDGYSDGVAHFDRVVGVSWRTWHLKKGLRTDVKREGAVEICERGIFRKREQQEQRPPKLVSAWCQYDKGE